MRSESDECNPATRGQRGQPKWANKNAVRVATDGVCYNRIIVMRSSSVLGRPGDALLSQVLRHSTIGAEEFNGRVRDGIGFRLLATATRPAKDR